MTYADVVDEGVLVAGPLASRAFIENYITEHPDILWETDDYLYMYDVVKNLKRNIPTRKTTIPTSCMKTTTNR